MSLWGKSVTRRYVHEYPVLNGKAIKHLLSLRYGHGRCWQSRAGRKIECSRCGPDADTPTFRVALTGGQTLIVRLKSTRTAFNGLRWWFICPHCARRCGLLHWTNTSAGCRRCLKLHYRSQSESQQDRALRRIRSARYAIWGEDEPEINNLFCAPYTFPKPEKMHWRTFEEKRECLIQRENRYFLALRVILNRRNGGNE